MNGHSQEGDGIDAGPPQVTRWSSTLLTFLVFLVFGAIYLWNAARLPFGSGYDEPGHAAYIRGIAVGGAIPSPFSGWSTFHPPIYYLVCSVVWSALDPLGSTPVIFGIRVVSVLSILLVGLIAYRLLVDLGFSRTVARLSTALLLSIPAVVMSASWIGNEAMATAVSAGACYASVQLARRRADWRWALLAGSLSGLAFASKYTGMFTAAAVLAASLDPATRRLHVRTAALAMLAMAIVATPVLARNVSATGHAFPMTRGLGPIARIEAITRIDRTIGDYLTFDPRSLLQPRIFDRATGLRSEHMKGVWSLTYAGFWSDPFEHRLPVDTRRGLLDLLPWVGLLPTLLTLLGMIVAARDSAKAPEERGWLPLLAMTGLALAVYVWWTWQSATLVAVKASYLLPLMVPGVCFFARGLQVFSGPARAAAIAASWLTVAVSAVVLTYGLLYVAPYNFDRCIQIWGGIAAEMPQSGIRETLEWWLATP